MSPTDFDTLRNTAAANPSAVPSLWKATFELENWAFIGRGEVGGHVAPSVGTHDEKPYLFAFTDGDRANTFGHQNQLLMTGAEGAVGVLSMPTRSAVRMAIGLKSQGVHGLMFNYGPAGYFALLDNLVGMFAHCHGLSLVAAAEHLGVDPADSLHDRLAKTGHNDHYKELVIWAFAQPHWYFFADAKDRRSPLVWTSADTLVSTAVFTSAERLQSGGRLMRLADEAGHTPQLKLSVAEAVERIMELVKFRSLQQVALNLRTPIKADAMEGLQRAVRES